MEPLFSTTPIPLNLTDAPEIAVDERVVVSESLLHHLSEFLGAENAQHIHAGHVGILNILEYREGEGEGSVEMFTAASLTLSGAEVGNDTTANATMEIQSPGRPKIFVTQEFLYHLRPAEAGGHEWELVP